MVGPLAVTLVGAARRPRPRSHGETRQGRDQKIRPEMIYRNSPWIEAKATKYTELVPDL